MKKIALYLLVMLSTISFLGCSSKDNRLPPTPLASFTPKIKIQKLWHIDVGNGASSYYLRMVPAIANNFIFTASYSGQVTAIDCHNGNIVWQKDLKTKLTSGISANGGKLYIGSEYGKIIALEQTTGKESWRAQVGSEILATPTATHNIVLVKSIDGNLSALDKSDGKILWSFSQNVPGLILHAASQPQLADGKLVIAGFANGRIATINIKTGNALWIKQLTLPKGSTAIEQMVDVDVSPVVIGGVVYIANYQGHIAALNLKTGRSLWQHDISSYSGITADSHYIYISDADSYIWAFDENHGTVVWRQNSLKGRMVTAPTLFGNYILIGDAKGYLHWLDKNNGEFVGRNYLDRSGMIARPIVKDGIVYTYTRKGNLYALRVMK